MIQCTVSGNSVIDDPNLGYPEFGGLDSYGVMTLSNSIVAGNSAASSLFANVDGSFTGSNNFTSGNPYLAPLGNYGGPTPTMPPLARLADY